MNLKIYFINYMFDHAGCHIIKIDDRGKYFRASGPSSRLTGNRLVTLTDMGRKILELEEDGEHSKTTKYELMAFHIYDPAERFRKLKKEYMIRNINALRLLTDKHQSAGPKIYGCFTDKEDYSRINMFAIIEHVKGMTIKDYLSLHPEDFDNTLNNLLNLIKYLHRNYLFHRNITSENVVIEDETQRVRMINFDDAILTVDHDYEYEGNYDPYRFPSNIQINFDQEKLQEENERELIVKDWIMYLHIYDECAHLTGNVVSEWPVPPRMGVDEPTTDEEIMSRINTIIASNVSKGLETYKSKTLRRMFPITYA
jgi:serine/threonine protein kinase